MKNMKINMSKFVLILEFTRKRIKNIFSSQIKLASLTNSRVTMENVFKNVGSAIKRMIVEMAQMR